MKSVAGRFAVKPVVAALAVAFGAVNAYADPTPTQLPGAGLIRAVSTGTTISSPSVFYLVSGAGTAGDQVYNGSPGAPFFPGSIQLDNAGTSARAVIRWGGNTGSFESFNPHGFNIGQNATVFFTSSATVTSAAVLNIDASGNPSQIFGKLIGTSDVKLGTGVTVTGVGGGAPPAIFVANTNGIIVGPLGQVQSPTGVALIAANLTNTTATPSTAEWDFVGNNGATSPAPPGLTGVSFLDVMGGITDKSVVDVRGFIDGGGNLFNVPATYVLLVGGDVVNTGNIFGTRIDVLAGMRGYSSTTASDTVNGISKVAVQRLFNVDTGAMMVANPECTTSTTCLEVSRTGSSFTNTGTIASKGATGYVNLVASGGASGIRSGTAGSTDVTKGIFSDNSVLMNTYEPGSTIELYNVLSGYSLNVLLPTLSVNQAAGWNGDVIVDLLQRGTEPSALTTTGNVAIRGVNVLIDSTINHTASALSKGNLTLASGLGGVGSMTVNEPIGAGHHVTITNSGAGGIVLASDITSDLDGDNQGFIRVSNTASGAPTTITGGTLISNGLGPAAVCPGAVPCLGDISITVNGDLTIDSDIIALFDDLNITNNKSGATTIIGTGNTVVGSNFTAPTNGDTNITVWGPLDINVALLGSAVDVNVTQNSLAGGNTTTIAGNVLALNDVNITNNGGITTKLYIDATISTSPLFDGENQVRIFSGGDLRLATINNAGGGGNDTTVTTLGLNSSLTGPITTADIFTYTSPNGLTKVHTSAQLSAATTNLAVLNFRGVQDDGSNYTDVSQKPDWQIMTSTLNIVAWGSINAPIDGNTYWLDNQMQVETAIPGSPVFTTLSAVGGGFQALNLGFTGDLVVNSGSTLTPFAIVGFATPVIFPPPLVANGGSQLILHATGNIDINGSLGPLWPLSPASFQFPGGVVFKSDTGYISLNTPLYNSWTLNAAAYQGVFFEAPVIITTSYITTNPNSWVNYSSYPLTGPANTYVITQPLPGQFQFVLYPDAIHYNVYSELIQGGPNCTTPNPAPPWPPAGC